MIDYLLGGAAKRVTLEFATDGADGTQFSSDSKRTAGGGTLLRRGMDAACAGTLGAGRSTPFRVEPARRTSACRALRLQDRGGFRRRLPIVPEGMLIAPGDYDVVLDVDGQNCMRR